MRSVCGDTTGGGRHGLLPHDAVFATALQFVVHAMDDLPGGSCELAALILRACEVIQAAVTDSPGTFEQFGRQLSA